MSNISPTLYDVEHTLNVYADGFTLFPAAAMYDEEIIEKLSETITKSHIYMLGFMPEFSIKSVAQRGRIIVISFTFGGELLEKVVDLPDGFELEELETGWRIANAAGQTKSLRPADLHPRPMTFEIVYIGQAYGTIGDRNALDRLQAHGTLQKISLTDVRPGYVLYVNLIELFDGNRNFTVFLPDATDRVTSNARIEAGTTKLFETTEKERVSLFEAAFIRYFEPKYNKLFKDTFPSTDMKLLAECYNKDFQGLVAEISIDSMPHLLFSEKRPATADHIAIYNLHADDERRAFFFDAGTAPSAKT